MTDINNLEFCLFFYLFVCDSFGVLQNHLIYLEHKVIGLFFEVQA